LSLDVGTGLRRTKLTPRIDNKGINNAIIKTTSRVGDYSIVAEFSKKSVYIFASVIAVVGFVMQDVVADTMSTEVIDKNQSKEEIHQELASIQVLARLSLGFAIFITGWIGGELADVFKDEREVVFMIALFIPLLSILGVSLVRPSQNQQQQSRWQKYKHSF
jgi:hypothetical protein